MIELKRKEDCCGYSACMSICPKQCIVMKEDEEGFLYPRINADNCINCHLCEKVCPSLNRVPANAEKTEVIAARCANDNLRMQSTSGGIFTLLAEKIISEGGVVFGARWNEDFTAVIHDFTETFDGLAAFRGSKYLQSVISNNFVKAKQFLLAGRQVLFTGTPCQIAGLKRFLVKKFNNLLAVEVACHAVPSPMAWRKYYLAICDNEKIKTKNTTNVSFRKRVVAGTEIETHFCIEQDDKIYADAKYYNYPFGKAFLGMQITRPSCHKCPGKEGLSGADITLGDFWNIKAIDPQINVGEGISAVIAWSENGRFFLNAIKQKLSININSSFEIAAVGNGGIRPHASHWKMNDNRFLKELNSLNDVAQIYKLFKNKMRASFKQWLKSCLISTARKVCIFCLIKKIREKQI